MSAATTHPGASVTPLNEELRSIFAVLNRAFGPNYRRLAKAAGISRGALREVIRKRRPVSDAELKRLAILSGFCAEQINDGISAFELGWCLSELHPFSGLSRRRLDKKVPLGQWLVPETRAEVAGVVAAHLGGDEQTLEAAAESLAERVRAGGVGPQRVPGRDKRRD